MLKRLVLVLGAVNLGLMMTTAMFICLWATREEHGALARSLITHVLVQFHLATENVLAAWYSSMMLLAVAVLCGAAYVVDCRGPEERRRFAAGWLALASAFAVLSVDEIGSLHERVGMVEGAGLTGRALGWAYVLAVPIAVVGLFMLAFAWLHLRRTPRVLYLVTAGVALFVSNPVLEQIEMSIIHGANAGQGGWPRAVHDGLLVLEEGVNELFGTLCFLSAAALYLQHAPAAVRNVRRWALVPRGVVLSVGAVLTAGAMASSSIVSRLPAADSGILANWFPAAALFLLACGVVLRRGAGAIRPAGAASLWLAIASLALSAWFGAGLHAYTTWHRFDVLREFSRTTLLVGFVVPFSIVATRRWNWMALAGPAAIAAAVNVTTSSAPALASIGGMLCAAWLLDPPLDLPPECGSHIVTDSALSDDVASGFSRKVP